MRARWVVSCKAFLAALLAVHTAFALGLERPSWALVAIYTVAQPLAGAIRSKAMYRVIGVGAGAAVGVFLAGLFVSSPGTLLVALIAWTVACGYVGTVDPTPRNYMYLQAGITSVIVTMPGLVEPTNIFSTALLRAQEIGLGLAAMLLVDSVFFPRSAEAALAVEVGTWLSGAEQWMLDALSDDPQRRAASSRDRQRLAAGTGRIDELAHHVRYENDRDLRRLAGVVGALRERALLLLPVLSAIEDAARDLRGAGAPTPPHLQAFRRAFHDWVRRGSPAGEAAAPRVCETNSPAKPKAERTQGGASLARSASEEIGPARAGPSSSHALKARLRSDRPAGARWPDLVVEGLEGSLAQLVDIWSDCRLLQRHLADPHVQLPERLRHAAAGTNPARHRDSALALWSSISVATSFFAVCAFWQITRWPNGGTAALNAMLMPLFLGRMDDPAAQLARMVRLLALGSVAGGLYLYAVLAHVHTFATFALALAPLLLPAGLLVTDRATRMAAIFLLIQLGFSNGQVSDFASFVNGAIASLLGLIAATATLGIVRSIGADTSARRILRAGWRDMAALAAAPRDADFRAFAARMLDRLGLLVPRLTAVARGDDLAATDALVDLRTGFHLIRLEESRGGLGAAANRAATDLLEGIAAHYRSLRSARREVAHAPPAALLRRVDEALAAAAGDATAPRPAVLALVGIRRGLFPGAPPPPSLAGAPA